MIWVVLLLLATVLMLLIRWKAGRDVPAEPVDPEQAMKAAIELHAIRRRLDVAWTKTEQRQNASRLRREMTEALGDESQ
jgi:hypothetical protein